jgi:uncharacterized radical SAM superfamily Fe-S cluster-containing enzyme
MSRKVIRNTTSLCARCKRSLPARLEEVGGEIVLVKDCPEHGPQEALISSNAEWYHETMSYEPRLRSPRATPNEVDQGCPFDCGACEQHEQEVLLPIIPITSACNLSCPICYTHNKNDDAYHMAEEELQSILERLRTLAPDKRIVNVTGGEPTQHPHFERLIEMCRDEGIHRVTISTHGMRFIKEEALLEKLAEIDARIILSFDSFDDPTNKAMLGGNFTKGKMQVLELLEKYQVGTTLLPVLARGKNDDELGDFIELGLSRDFIRSIEIHPMTFTGQFGASFDRRARYTAYDVLSDLEKQSEGRLRIDDFVPSPSAHPLCYQVTYLLRMAEGDWLPMPRFMEKEDLRDLLTGRLYLEPDERTERKLHDVISRLWAGDIECARRDEVLEVLRALVDDIFAPNLSDEERLEISERSTKAIYIHSHMDEETFDTDRIQQCCVGIVEPDGSNIPSCAYNVLYRERDERFMRQPKPPLYTMGDGRK